LLKRKYPNQDDVLIVHDKLLLLENLSFVVVYPNHLVKHQKLDR